MVLQVSPLAVFWKDEGDCAPCAKQTTCTNSHLEGGGGECVQSMWNNINEESKQEFLFVMCFCWDLAPAPARPPKNNKEKKNTFSHGFPCKVPAAWPQGNALLHVIIFSNKDLGCRDNTSSWEALRSACHRTRRQQPKMAMSGPGYLQDLFLRAAKQNGHRPGQAPCATCRWPGHSSALQVDEERKPERQ